MYAAEIEIERPVSDVYREFMDPDNMPRWLQGLQRWEHISGTPGEVGSVGKQIYLERGKIVEMIETITSVEPEEHLAGTLEAPGMQCNMRVDFVDKGDRTLMKFQADFASTGLMMKLMLPFMKGAVQKRQMGDLQRFKELVEAEGA